MSEVVASGLTVRYSGSPRPAVEGVSFRVPRGSLALVLGRSGSGKSTLVKALTGVIPHVERGEVEGGLLVGGVDPRSSDPYTVPRAAVYAPTPCLGPPSTSPSRRTTRQFQAGWWTRWPSPLRTSGGELRRPTRRLGQLASRGWLRPRSMSCQGGSYISSR
ncbi:hypothetical protein B6U99_06210 [Candidatus Geothermarchaeota archaeon ex4572_27]|nr:MAG: hypothetical protein B6U99_06210 [Candidatus Geothermarchaeota archaeon ex4572_27]